MRTRIKICGITRPQDALAAAQAGADAIGLVFYEGSSRAVDIARAEQICAALPAFVSTVGLFVDAPEQQVNEVLQRVPLDLLQFHGEETPQYCGLFSRPWIKALRMRDDIDLAVESTRYADARALLLDAWVPGQPGGTGETFDWQRVPRNPGYPVILAGGLNPDNVASAVHQCRPWAVDVSGGVEERPGIKSATAISAFVRGVMNEAAS